MGWTTALKSLEAEIVFRLLLVFAFLASEECKPFVRVIHKEEFWVYGNPRRPDYYPAWLMILVSAFLPPIVIYLCFRWTGRKKEAVQALLAVSLSTLTTSSLTNLFKNLVGRPRPDFMNRCFPSGIPENPFDSDGVYLKCDGDLDAIIEGRKSFPSGHSSLSFASVGFLFFYLARTFGLGESRGRGQSLRLLTTSLPFLFCVLVAISRTCDYHHHWQDVTVGSLLGFAIAYLCFAQYLSPTDQLTSSSEDCLRLTCPQCRHDLTLGGPLRTQHKEKSTEKSPYLV